MGLFDNDVLTGNSGDNRLDGDDGDDRLIGADGADVSDWWRWHRYGRLSL